MSSVTRQWVIGRGYELLRSLWDEKQSGDLTLLELPDHSPEFCRRMSWLCAARRAFETMDTIRLRRALLAFVRARTHIKGICERRTGLCFGGRSRKNRTDARTALVAHRWYGAAIVVGRGKNNVFVSSRGRVTKVAPECVRKASVAEQNELGHHDERKSFVRKCTRQGKPLV